MSHMQSVPGGVEQEALAEEKELAEGFRPEKGRKKIATGEGRLAFFLVTPTVLLLALIVGYPIVKAIYQLVPEGPGAESGHRLLQQGRPIRRIRQLQDLAAAAVPDAGGGTVKCPPGTLGSEFWAVGGLHARRSPSWRWPSRPSSA